MEERYRAMWRWSNGPGCARRYRRCAAHGRTRIAISPRCEAHASAEAIGGRSANDENIPSRPNCRKRNTVTSRSKPPRQTLAPRGAAIAGVIFSLLMVVAMGIARSAVPSNLTQTDVWLTEPDRRAAVRLALYLIPFAGIAFLWFMGVLRNRLGELEDKFFATVFLGSGLLFVTCLFGAAAMSGALIEVAAAGNLRSSDSATLYFGRRATDALLNMFAMKMAGVFMISTCTIGWRSAISRDGLHLPATLAPWYC